MIVLAITLDTLALQYGGVTGYLKAIQVFAPDHTLGLKLSYTYA